MKPSVQLYVVVAPGVDPQSVELGKPEITKLSFKFAEMERGDLIDQVKQVDLYMSALEKWCAAAREVLKNTLPKPTLETPETITAGKLYEAHYIRMIRVDVDRDKIKERFGEEMYAKELCKTSEVYMLKITERTQTPGVVPQ